MSDRQAKTRPRASRRDGAGPAHSEAAPASASQAERGAVGPHYAAGPAMGLGTPVQTKVEIGQPGDGYEQEAEAVAGRVMSGATLAPPVPARGAGVVQPAADEKRPEEKPVQKAEASKPDEKKPEQKTVQKAEAPKPDEKKPEQKTVQKAEAPKPDEKKPEQKTVQKAEAPKPEEKKPEQKAIQKAETPAPEEKKPEQAAVQKAEERPSGGKQSGDAGRGTTARGPGGQAGKAGMASVADEAIAHAGPGRPMNEQTRSALEKRMHHDFSHVRIHDDDKAHEVARNLNARAFTHGQDIWLGRGESDTDMALMAHELTHVMQQGGEGGARRMIQRKESAGASVMDRPASHVDGGAPVVQRPRVQRAPPRGGSSSGGGTGGASGSGGADTNDPGEVAADVITFKQIRIPSFKLAGSLGALYGSRQLRRMKGYRESIRPRDYRDKWKKEVGASSKAAVERILREKETQAHHGPAPGDAGQPHVFKYQASASDRTPRYFIGSYDTIAEEMSLPYWSRNGAYHRYDVDHIVELQVANWNADQWGNTVPNMQLLDPTLNRSSGGLIGGQIDAKVRQFITAHSETRSPNQIKDNYHLAFQTAVPGETVAVSPQQQWQRTGEGSIESGAHANIPKIQAGSLGELGRRGELRILPSESGGVSAKFAWSGPDDTGPVGSETKWLAPFRTTKKEFNIPESDAQQPTGRLSFNVPANDKKYQRFPQDHVEEVTFFPGARYAGHLDKQGLIQRLRGKRLPKYKHASPIDVQQIDVVPEGLFIAGVLRSDIPLIRDVAIDVEVRGDDLRLSKTFRTGEFTVPRPLVVRDSSLTIAAGTESGLSATGRVEFGIERVGEGYLQASASTSAGLDLEGHFNFDSKLFTPAEITMRYRNDRFSGEGHIGIREGKVRGIKSADVTVSYAEGVLQATGNAELDVPGVRRGAMNFRYSEAEGFVIGGSFELADNIPGIRSGSGQAEVRRRPGSDDYIVTARGTAVPKIPGVEATINVAYEDGALTIEGSAAYQKGMLSGAVLVGVTNRPVDPSGRPAGEPGRQLRAYGGGTVTIRIAPWLQGTIGIRLLPNGEMEVSGAIGLPSSLTIFPEKRLDKNIFTIGIDIPIVGFTVLGQRVGIFATIGGGLDLSAGIGPGQLQDLGLAITYNPAHEDQTHITGTAKLHIPAHAGLRLFVRGALGAGIPLVSAQAGLEIGAQLGLEGALDAGVQVDWTPASGLKIDAFGELYAEPKLKFDITGFVLVELDLLFTTTELYSKRWQLAAFEYGSGLRLGVKFPIHYEEGRPFDISLSDVQFEVPHIDPGQLLGDLIHRLV